MKNIKMERNGDILRIEIDLAVRGDKSSSGKSVSIATTAGNVTIPGRDEIKIGINCYTPVK